MKAKQILVENKQGGNTMRKIFVNGGIYTFDKMHPQVEAVVVEKGRFIDLGTTDDMLKKWRTTTSEVIDFAGKAVTPGLVDSHLHICGIANNFLNLDVTGVTSKREMLQKIRHWAETLKDGAWLVGRGWDENIFTDGTIPTIEELDAVAPNNPLYIPRICGHASLVNSAALKRSKYHRDMPIPEGGTVVLDEKTGQPTGLLLESASQIVTKHIPEPSYEDLKRGMRQAIKFVMKKGLTSVHTNDPHYLGGVEQTWKLYDELIHGEDLKLRTNLLIDHEYLDDIAELGFYTGYGDHFLQVGAVKIFADGAMGRRTALLSEPYNDAPGQYGDAMFDQETLYTIVKRARQLGMPIAVHTIGDQALENILDILDQFPTVAYRDRLIHIQVLREDLIKRLLEPSRIADIQPRFLAGDFPWVIDRLGEERMKSSYAWKTLIDAGVVCAGGSDCPVEPVDPLLGIHAAVTRKLPNENHDGYYPEQKLTMEQAFKLFTKMGAYPTNEETFKGTITRGKLADMTVYSENPFTMEDADQLLETTINMTIIDGHIMYKK